jgi:hypothetical protein
MSHNVQHIPVIIPGSDAGGSQVIKFCNMVLCGTVFLTMAVWARKITVTTQTSVVELVKNLSGTNSSVSAYSAVPQSEEGLKSSAANMEEEVELAKVEDGTSKQES